MDSEQKKTLNPKTNAVCDGRGEVGGRAEVSACTQRQGRDNATLVVDATVKP